MRTSLAIAVLLAVCGLAALPATPASADHFKPPSPCALSLGHAVAPSRLLLGETTTVSVHLSALCTVLPTALHVVFAIGDPRSMTAQDRRDARDVAQAMTEDLLQDPSARVAVVGQRGALSCNATGDLKLVLRCLDRALDPRGRTEEGPAEGVLTAAGVVLRRAHLQFPAWSTREVVMLIADSPTEQDCAAWLRQAGQLKGSGILMITAGVGRPCSSRCLTQIAASPRYAFCLHDRAVFQLFDRIREDIFNVTLREVVLDYPLPTNVAYVTDTLRSLDPRGVGSYDSATHRIAWRTTYIPTQGVTVTLDVQPTVPGVVALGASATVRAIDSYRLALKEELVAQDVGVFGSP